MQPPAANSRSQSPWPPLTYWPGLTDYTTALERQNVAVSAILSGSGAEQLIFCEHPPVVTIGTSGNATTEILNTNHTPVLESSRGGKTTYHGPGQRVIYPILDLNRRGRDLHAYVQTLQQWVIESLQDIGVDAQSDRDVGVWVKSDERLEKIAAIGIRIRRWVAFHGIAINVSPDLEAFKKIIPCGISDKGVTSLEMLGITTNMADFDQVLLRHFPKYFPPLEN